MGAKDNGSKDDVSGNVATFPIQSAYMQESQSDHVDKLSISSDIEAKAKADARAYRLTKAYTNTICAVVQLETTPNAAREWIRFSRMTRDEIEGTVTDINVAIDHLIRIKSALSGSLAPRKFK